ncbi:SDR family NAD(P)-dependent oxidoreductase [Catenovulum sediminis]|uniref:SDR family NAD(P)-dependent oxidoreductase n=1 Tax=Catenovulum sediminis TaxID=1740262 RepID=UPI00117E35FD|nr:SDR family NAD(P)-dependent oxidoreductase [Catenovulum sediminis]
MSRQSVLITGATSGIGRALAELYQQQGFKVIAVGRNLEKLQQLESLGIQAFSCDVSSKAEVKQLCETLHNQNCSLDICILNAGGCLYMNPQSFDSEIIVNSIQQNFFSAVYCFEALLPLMSTNCTTAKNAGKAKVAFMGSLATQLPFTKAQGYGASKAALAYFVDALRVDYSKNLSIVLIEPGFVKTPLTEKNEFDMPVLIEANDAALHIYQGLAANKKHIHFPKRLSWTLKLLNRLPIGSRHAIAMKMAQGNSS